VAQAAAEMAITTITQKAAVQTLTQAMNFSKASLKLIS
jgi:hypothetical protein